MIALAFRKTMCVSEFDVKGLNWMYNRVYEDRMLFKERWKALLEDGKRLDLEVCLDAPGPWLVEAKSAGPTVEIQVPRHASCTHSEYMIR